MDGEAGGPTNHGDLLRQALELSPIAHVVLSTLGVVLMATDEARRMVGRDPGGQHFADLLDARDRERVRRLLDGLQHASEPPAADVSAALLPAGRSRRTVRLQARWCPSAPGGPVTVVALTPTRWRGRRGTGAEQDADALTGLPDRSRLFRALDEACRSTGPAGAVAVLDLHRFREVNARWGHHAGDRVLRQVARRLEAHAPPDALVARIGGDEFALLVPGTTVADSVGALRAMLDEVHRPYRIDGEDVVVMASVGVAPTTAGSSDLVLRQADAAMHEAKKAGPDRVVPYGPTVARWAENLWDLAATLAKLEQDRSRYELESRTDALTGLPNLRALREALRSLSGTPGSDAHPLSVLFIDLDHFGAFNKQQGDAAGDGALRRVAGVVAGACRSGDTAYRKGGEELVVLLPRTGHDDAVAVGERVRAAVEDMAIPHGGHPDSPVLTVTVGVATARPGDTVDQVQAAAADAALRSKLVAGRNRTVSAEL